MEIDSKYTKRFDSNNLTRLKYDEIKSIAVLIRDYRNEISKYVSKHLFHFLEIDKYTFEKEIKQKCPPTINSCFYKEAYVQVFTNYQNKFDAIKRRILFLKFVGFKEEKYKRNTKNHKKDDIKCVKKVKEQTKLTMCLSFLARYGNKNTYDYIKNTLSNLIPTNKKEKQRIELYSNILDKCNKFGFERLLALALQRRENIIQKYNKEPIEYKSLTFSGRTQRKTIIEYNKEFDSEINAFIGLSGFEREVLYIPVKFNKDYHGSINKYRKSYNHYEYFLKFNERKKEVVVFICINGKREIPDAQDNIVGIDVNSKNNLFTLSDGTTYDYDHQLLKDYCELSKRVDELKKDKKYEVGKRKQQKLDTLKNKIEKNEENLIAKVCKELQKSGVHHIVMEDLRNTFEKCYIKDKQEKVNYNRIVKFLGLSSIKNKFEHIARKYGIAVSKVHAYYTSKMCPICGCIDDNNRQTQEVFECVECGHKDNADHNAAINIKNRVTETVFLTLLKQLDNKAYEPKSLKKELVKEVLESFRSKPQQNQVVSVVSNLLVVGNNCLQ